MVRFTFFAALFSLAGASLAPAQGVVRPHSLTLEVTPVSAGNTVQNSSGSGSSSTGSNYSSGNTRTISAKEAIQISVRNLGTVPDNAHVEWYFMAAPLHPEPGVPAGDQEFIFDQGSKDLAVAAGGTQAVTAESVEVTNTVKSSRGRASSSSSRSRRSTSYSSAKSQKPQETGSVLRGWMVRVVADGKVVTARGSRQAYEDIARNDAQLADLADNKAPVVSKSSYPKKGNYRAGDR